MRGSEKVATAVVGFDSNYAFAGVCAISSAHLHANRQVFFKIFYFRGDLETSIKSLIVEVLTSLSVNYEFVEVTDDEYVFDERRWLTRATYLKLVSQDTLTGSFVWLDSDTLALPGWDSIFDITSSKKILAASERPNNPTNDVFNAGVIRWTSAEREPWRETLARFSSDRYSSDQVIFNAIYKDNVEFISAEFNSIWGNLVTDAESIHPKIVHYGGAYKPWHLHEAFHRFCLADSCVWTPYYLHIKALRSSLGQNSLKSLSKLQTQALFMGKKYTAKEALAREFGRFLSKRPHLMLPIVVCLRFLPITRFAQVFHPLHGRKGVWSWGSQAKTKCD